MTATGIARAPLVSAPGASRSSGWWGIVCLIATESVLFLLAIASYFYLRTESRTGWPPAPLHDPEILKPLGANLLLVVSCIPLVAASRAVDAGNAARARAWLALTTVLGLGFVAVQVILTRQSLGTFSPRDSAYGSIYYSLAGIHLAHAAAGVLALAWLVTRLPRSTARRRVSSLDVVSLYWFFVVVSAVLVFLTLDVAVRG